MIPLYEKLKSEINQVGDINWDELLTIIENLTHEEHEIIYALIYHYYKINKEKCTSMKLLKGGNGVIVYINKLPTELQKIIYLYLK